MYENYLEFLSKISLFKGIENSDFETMLNCLKPKLYSYHKNEYIAIAGDEFESIGILINGEAIISKENSAGNRIIMNMVKPGDMFGEMIAFSNQTKWPATVQAQNDCEVLFLSKNKIVGQCEKICPWHKNLIENMLKIISNKAIMLNKKVEYLTIKSLKGKISTYLLDQYNKTGQTFFMLDMNRNELADFFNVSRPSLSREMCNIKDEGIIDFHKSSIKILDINKLKKLSD